MQAQWCRDLTDSFDQQGYVIGEDMADRSRANSPKTTENHRINISMGEIVKTAVFFEVFAERGPGMQQEPENLYDKNVGSSVRHLQGLPLYAGRKPRESGYRMNRPIWAARRR